jgi:hypothetical protein
MLHALGLERQGRAALKSIGLAAMDPIRATDGQIREGNR